MRQRIKLIVRGLFAALMYPVFLWFLLLSRFFNEDSIFSTFSQYFSLIPGKFGAYCRAAFYHRTCPDTAVETLIGFGTVFSHRNTSIKEGVYIGPQGNIGQCEIGRKTLLGSGVHVLSGNRQHGFDRTDLAIQDQSGHFEKISIGQDCWLGNCSIIMASVADHTVVAAGAVVTRPITEPMGIYAGNPAKRIKTRAVETEPNNSGS